jgi:hypothetical protein
MSPNPQASMLKPDSEKSRKRRMHQHARMPKNT